MPEYEEKYLDCPAEIRELELDYKKAKGRSQFMVGRRLSDMVYAYTLQKMNIHSVLAWYMSDGDGWGVCSCGLKLDDSEDLTTYQGHLFDGQPVSQIIFNSGPEFGYVALCLDCRITHFTIQKGEYEFYGIPDIDVEVTLAQHGHCVPPVIG